MNDFFFYVEIKCFYRKNYVKGLISNYLRNQDQLRPRSDLLISKIFGNRLNKP